MTSRRAVLAVGATLLVVPACGLGVRAPTEEQIAAYTEQAPPVGKRVTFFMYTHCGVESARIGGRWWHVTKPLYDEPGGANPPAGWGNPYQEGRLVLESSKRAVFEAEGRKVVLVPAPKDEPVRVCM